MSFLILLILASISAQLTIGLNHKCEYELDVFNCLNVNCNGKQSIKKLPATLSELVEHTMTERQFLCSLDLAETGITEISGQTLDNFFHFFNNLIQTNPNQSTTILKISFSNIEFVKEIRLPALNLVLFIRDSKIKHVQPKSLSSVQRLELNFLNLSMSSINWFHMLQSAKFKLLSMRNIENLKEEFNRNNRDFLLYPIASIIDIKIYNSYLPIIDDYFYLFKLLKYVEQLELIGCSISFIKNSIFDKYSNTFRFLKHLTLSSNNLNKISDKTFNGLTNLVFLDLDDNPIEYIHPNTFTGLKKLRTLSININNNYLNIKTIGPMANLNWFFNILKSNNEIQDLSYKTHKLLNNNFCTLNTLIMAINNQNEMLRLASNRSEQNEIVIEPNRQIRLFSQEEIDYGYEDFINNQVVYCAVYFVCKYLKNFSNAYFNAWNLETFRTCSSILKIKDMDYVCTLEQKVYDCKHFYGEKPNKYLSNLNGNQTHHQGLIFRINKVFSNFNTGVIITVILLFLIGLIVIVYVIYSCIKNRCLIRRRKRNMIIQNRNTDIRPVKPNLTRDYYGAEYYVVLVNKNQLKV